MSYDIIYQKQFIKAQKNGEEVFIPMIECGSSNCYDISYNKNGRERRSRSWFCHTNILGGNYYGTKEEILKGVEAIREREISKNTERLKEYPDWDVYSDDRFGWFTAIKISGGQSTYGRFKGLYITGCKKAVTVETLKEFGISVHLNVYVYHSNLDKFTKAGYERFDVVPSTSEELIRLIDEKVEYLKGSGHDLSITFSGWDDQFKDIRKTFNTKNTITKQERVDVDHFYTLENEDGYFVRNTKYGYRYSGYIIGRNKKFFTEAEAEKFRKKLRGGDLWKVKRIDSYTTLYRRVKAMKEESLV